MLPLIVLAWVMVFLLYLDALQQYGKSIYFKRERSDAEADSDEVEAGAVAAREINRANSDDRRD